ncbi:hypothetical protein N7536_011914 [Penicillium majusculum]|nr:hypothetical protein N7536_011914 [Penicillium majusculum]
MGGFSDDIGKMCGSVGGLSSRLHAIKNAHRLGKSWKFPPTSQHSTKEYMTAVEEVESLLRDNGNDR